MAEKKFLTREGYERLKQDLDYLRIEKRAEIAEKIRSAKEDGDVSENAGYEDAKHEQAFIEGRIQELEALLKSAQIIEDTGRRDRIGIGVTVVVREDGYEPETYQIVGSAEANPSEGRVSNESPLGRALLGGRVGDTVDVSTPGGVAVFKIIEIK
ncbi:MAG: transcription elongation factor GreA [Anaerolineae bacterium]|nr:transcription elongation factor GreA [Anaerolineae bacterium]